MFHLIPHSNYFVIKPTNYSETRTKVVHKNVSQGCHERRKSESKNTFLPLHSKKSGPMYFPNNSKILIEISS